MNGGFRLARRAGSEKPDRRIVAPRVGSRQFIRRLRREFVVMRKPAPLIADHQNVLQVSRLFQNRPQIFNQRFVNDKNLRASVIEVIGVIFGRQQRIDHRDHRADFGRAEPAGDKLRAIGQSEQSAVFDVRAQFAQQMPGAVRLPGDLGVCPAFVAEPQADLAVAPCGQIVVKEIFGHVEIFGECDHMVSQTS
ncbi:MAG: hypothetical protein JMDDDDMK_03448 [Acidobacteria bacterium]|nr:hypothetical protein [Acidobacteriota bacterium]